MYNIHAIKVQEFSQQTADNLVDVILMVLLSIQQNWLSVGIQLQDVKENREASKFLWGNKRKAYNYITTNKHFMFGQFKAVLNSKQTDEQKADALMKIFLRVPGLGLVKAGFVCQLAAGLVGCIDLHNIRIYSIDEKALKISSKMSAALQAEKRKKYITLCHAIGTENLWNNWCNHLATKSDKWRDGNHVSEVHATYIGV